MATTQLPPQTLQGKIAIVTGSSRGLGADMARDLGRRGARVGVTYTSSSSEKLAADVVADIRGYPNDGDAVAVRADLGEPTSPQEVVEQVLAAFNMGKDGIDILVNNAGVQITRPLAEITLADFDSVYSVNVRGTILMTQAAHRRRRPGRPMRVVNVSSVGARAGFANLSLYTSSKAAMEGLTRSWAGELGVDGTTVNCVAPGPVQSDMLETIPPEIVAAQKASTPVQHRVGLPPEVSAVVSWLASDDASWISGQVINVSGGWSMY